MSFDVEAAFSALTTTMTQIHNENRQRFEKLEEKVTTAVTDIAIIKSITTDVKKDVYGNGTVGLKTRTIQNEERINNLSGAVDTATTTALVAKEKAQKLEAKIGRFIGIVVGINIVISALFAILINLDKIKSALHIS